MNQNPILCLHLLSHRCHKARAQFLAGQWGLQIINNETQFNLAPFGGHWASQKCLSWCPLPAKPPQFSLLANMELQVQSHGVQVTAFCTIFSLYCRKIELSIYGISLRLKMKLIQGKKRLYQDIPIQNCKYQLHFPDRRGCHSGMLYVQLRFRNIYMLL